MGWIGTPFRGMTRRKQVGVDCVNLAAGIYVETRVLREADCVFPRYRLDHGTHHGESMVIPFIEGIIERTGRLRLAASGADARAVAMPGDLLTFTVGRTEHHVGIALGGQTFVHVFCDYQVMESRLTDSIWAKRLTRVYRPIETVEAREVGLFTDLRRFNGTDLREEAAHV